MVSPTTLSGVEAPAVMPMRTVAGRQPAGGQRFLGRADRAMPDARLGSTHCGLSM